MKFSDIYKKGFAVPAVSDIIEGGLAIDVKGKRAYSKDETDAVFQIGLDEEQVTAIMALSPGVTPIGGIIMFAGPQNAIPANWALCNGNNGTPNLIDKFVMGTATTSAPHATGGVKDSVVPSHNHSIYHTHTATTNWTGDHNHTTSVHQHTAGSGNPSGTGWGRSYANKTSSTNGAHAHTVTVDATYANSAPTGVDGTDKNLPPYLKLAYIQRKS